MSAGGRDDARVPDGIPGRRRDPSPLERALLASLSDDTAHVERVVQGSSWIVAVVRGTRGQRSAGMAGIPDAMRGRCCVPGHAAAPCESVDIAMDGATPARDWARLLLSGDNGEAAVGLAVTNAMLALEPEPATPIDGVDWLLERAAGRSVAVIGAFPFVDRELRPVAGRVWVFERGAGAGELDEAEAPALLPHADIVVITGGTLANHTLEHLLRVTAPNALRMLLGPSTPLTPALFAFGIDALSGIRVVDLDGVVHAVAAGVGFRRMSGLERVTLLRQFEYR